MSHLYRMVLALAIAAAVPGVAQEKPVTLLAGLGTWQHPIATRNPEAQMFFDQGLVLLYGFNRYESLRSFRKAAELDPKSAMAYWGIAAALGAYVNMDGDSSYQQKESCEAVTAGLKIDGANETERAWLEAASARCPEYGDGSRYVDAMRGLAARFPDDPDAQAFFAESLMIPVRWKWYGIDGKPARGVAEAEGVLEAVIRRHPQHPGANHLYIHAVESSPNPERGVPSAQRLMAIVPAAGHMVHMPGHIWLVLGDFENCAAVNERAIEVDRKYFALTGITGSYEMYYLHNLDFLLYARMMQGRVAESAKVARQMADALAPMRAVPSMAEMTDVFGSVITQSQVRLQRWDELLASAPPKSDQGTALWRHSRALAYVAKDNLAAARNEQAEFEKIAKTLDRKEQWGNNKLGEVLDLASMVLTARLESPQKAVPLWKRAVEMQDGLVYDEPPAWYYPIRESLGGALLRSGDAAGAETVFREGVRRSPNNGRILFGLLESLKAQKKSDAAAWVQREFETAWRGADLKLSVKDL
jgi:tetratricopeptide (TPR) repeat protein